MTPHGRSRLRLAVLFSVLIGGGASVCWWTTRPAEVRGRERTRQDRVEARFDDAFSKVTAAPPARTLDGGPGLVDDGGTR
jgi:hypothetical protein